MVLKNQLQKMQPRGRTCLWQHTKSNTALKVKNGALKMKAQMKLTNTKYYPKVQPCTT